MLDWLNRHVIPPRTLAVRFPLRLVPMLVVAYACLLPREFQLTVMDAALPPYRLALLAFVPFAFGQLARWPVRPSFIDLCAVFAALWFPISLYMTTSLSAGLVSGGSYAIDLGLAYLLGRASVRSPQDVRSMFTWFIPGLLGVVAIMAAESVSHRMFFRPQLANLLNQPQPFYYHSVRFGLLRALGPFPHPILGGVFLASMLPLGWYLARNNWHRVLACGAALGAVFTVSATAAVGLLLGAVLVLAEIVQRLTRLPVFLVTGFYLAMGAAAISVGSQSGLVNFLIRRLTFEAGSGYYRLWIWEYGGAEAMANPWFGIGQRDWARPIGMSNDSVDAYWLVLAMFYGFPAVAGAAALMLGAIIGLIRSQRWRRPEDRGVALALIFFIIVVVFSGFTVHLWESLHSWIIMLCGASISLATQARHYYHAPQAPAGVALAQAPDAASRLSRA